MIERINQRYKIREEPLLPVPWCKDLSFSLNKVFTEFRIVGKDKNTGEMKNDITDIYDIFKTHEECEEPPQTFLIEGDPGIGKTTYCQKLAYFWVTSRKDWNEPFPKIALVLLLRCHDIRSNLWEAIDEQLLPDDIDEECKENLFKFIRESQFRVLFILDGLDEAADHVAIDVFTSHAQSTEFSKCFFVFTSGHKSEMKMRHYCDNLWEIVRFTIEETKHFINKYFGNRKNLAKRLCEEISHSRSDLRQLISNPLNTALLCILWENSITAFPESRSQLYIEIVKCVLRRYEEKEGISGNNEDIIEVYKEELRNLGRIALQSLLKGELYIEERRENANNFKSVNKFGFLSIQSESSERKPYFRYGFLHKSFQEFFAGFHLALSYIREEDEAKIKITDQKFLYELHQVFLYVCGVVAMQSEENAKRLLGKITVCVDMSEANFKEVVGNMKLAFCLIEECGKCKESLQSQLLHEFGVRLPLQACTLGMITRLDFFLESLSFNVSLTDLDLHLSSLRTMFSRAKIDNKEIDQLSQALSVNTKLTHLNLSGNEIDESGAKLLSKALFYNTALTHLNLGDNLVGARGVAYLSLALAVNTTLTYLNLDGNLAQAFGATYLSSVLSRNTTALTDLNLARNEIDDSVAESLSRALSVNTTLTYLNLSGNEIGAPGATYLSRALLANTTLTDLNLSNNEIDTSGAISLFKFLSRNTTLTHLNLSENNIRNPYALSFFEHLSDNTTLTNLNLSENNIRNPYALSFFEHLSDNTTLTNLNLSGNNIDVSDAPPWVFFSRNVRLTHLNLSDNNIDNLGAYRLSSFLSIIINTTLTHLNLSHNSIDGGGALFQILSGNTTLTHLNLSHNSIDGDGAYLLFQALGDNTTLTHLNLSGNEIGASGASGATYLYRALLANTTLTDLNLSNNEIDTSGAISLFKFLSRNTTLTHLNLSENNIRNPYALSFFEHLSDNTTLTNLNLSGNNIDVSDAPPWVLFSHSVRLTHLNLSHNSIDDSGVLHLSRALSDNITLTHLNLSHNSIDDGGALHLCQALSRNTTLTHLNLSHNSIDDGGALHLSQALLRNTTLTHLNLSHSSIDDGGARHLSRALSRNTALTHLNLSGNNIGYSGAVSLSPFQSILYWLI